jgi:hypothetical protein
MFSYYIRKTNNIKYYSVGGVEALLRLRVRLRFFFTGASPSGVGPLPKLSVMSWAIASRVVVAGMAGATGG